MLIAVSVHQRLAFVVIAVFRQAVADQPTPTSYVPNSVMPYQVSAQSVVAKSWPFAQGSAGFGCVLVSTVARCPYASVEEKRKTTAARTNFALFLFAPE